MSGKNYGDIRHLAMGDLSHEEIANKLLQMNSTHAELPSVLRGAHDRIMHLATTAVVATNDAEVEALRRQLADANSRIEAFGVELTEAVSRTAAEKERADNLQGEVNSLTAELNHIRETYDLDEAEAEGEEEGGGQSIEDQENESVGQAEGYMPSRPELKEIAIAHGFKTRTQSNGSDDLNEYVYVTMEKSIEYAHSKS